MVKSFAICPQMQNCCFSEASISGSTRGRTVNKLSFCCCVCVCWIALSSYALSHMFHGHMFGSNGHLNITANFSTYSCLIRTSLVAQTVKRLSTMRETWVWSLGWEDPLEKEMAIHSRTIAWKIPRTEEPGRLQSMGLQRVGHDWATSLRLTKTNQKSS